MHLPDLSLRRVSLFLLGAVLFAFVYCQAPLFYSNQNQYFLHGLAQAGEGLLDEDWLANTRDPTPVFSSLVALTVRYLHPWAFYLYYVLLQGVYAAVMLGLFTIVAGGDAAVRRWPVFVALFVAVHSALGRWVSYRWFGQDYPWFFQAGVAGQYLLGPVLQPSAFGVLLVAAVWLFVRGRPFLAAVSVALAATLHSTYLLVGGLLTLGFAWSLWAEGRSRRALAMGGLTLALVVPILVYVFVTFRPTSLETFAEAQDVLANFRIPHHARPDHWLDPVAALQIAWVVMALVLVRGTRLFAVLAVPFVLSALLTLAQVATGSPTLGLLFPWRVSAVLVPVATTVILSRLAALPGLRLEGPWTRTACAAVVGALAVAGVWIMAGRHAFSTSDEELPVMAFVKRMKEPGDVYFLPVRLPRPTIGSLSSDFKPLPEKRRGDGVIPYDFQRFRLHCEAPLFVDFKSVPYKDVEVLEWRDRLRVAQSVQKKMDVGRLSEALDELCRHGVTHLLLPAEKELPSKELEEVYKDEYYRVYRLPR
ncbi:MAG: hypothetical protein HYS12_05800 [Planctomycetes bacterium]|nr:hypothetical protein [Planctomycetota bacterium]